MTSHQMNQAIDRIAAMRKQEKSSYACVNYLSSEHFQWYQSGESMRVEARQKIPTPQHMRLALEECIRFIDSLSVGPSSNNFEDDSSYSNHHSCRSVAADISTDGYRAKKHTRNESFSTISTLFSMEDRITREELKCWRAQMCSWSYVVMDNFGFDREIVAIAYSFIDRYIALDEEPDTITREEYQLMSMTALYTAVKTMCFHGAIPVDALIAMSRENFSERDVAVMERKMLISLEWRLNPPTAIAFVREFLNFFPVSARDKQELTILSTHLTELAVIDAFFIDRSPSLVAAASIIIAASYHFVGKERLSMPSFVMNEFEKNLLRYAGIDITSDEVYVLIDRLEQVYEKQLSR